MAAIEKRGESFRIVFWFQGRRFRRSLETTSKTEAEGTLARLRDNLRRVALGLLVIPEDPDLATFLLSDGKTNSRPAKQAIHSLHELFENYFSSLPAGSIEADTIAIMRIHQAHLERILGRSFSIHSLEAAHLQRYIVKRSGEQGQHGRTVSPVTVKKDLRTLRTVWNWSLGMGLVGKLFPNRGLRFPKTEEKPPFQTLAEIERRIKRGGLTAAETADLWDCAFLTLSDIADLLDHVRRAAHQPFLYPMFVFAAHTGARRSEIIRSHWDDVDFESRSVLIREQKRVKTVLSTRRVPLSPRLASVLRNWQKEHPGGSFTFCHDLTVMDLKLDGLADGRRHLPHQPRAPGRVC
jgi:integrase